MYIVLYKTKSFDKIAPLISISLFSGDDVETLIFGIKKNIKSHFNFGKYFNSTRIPINITTLKQKQISKIYQSCNKRRIYIRNNIVVILNFIT